MVQTKPTIIELDMGKLEDALRRAEGRLDEQDYAMLKALADSYAYLSELVGDKTTTITRLRKLLFGAKTEKTAAVVGAPQTNAPTGPEDRSASGEDAPPQSPEQSTPSSATEGSSGGTAQNDAATSSRPRNHGRNGVDAYTGAEKIEVPHPSLQPGDPCPQCTAGTVYETGRPGVVIRLIGQAPVGAKVYYLQKLRCNLCGVVFSAQPPDQRFRVGARNEKYDATAGSMMALLKYGSGVPFHRAETLQAGLGIPLPASTQWDIVAAQAERAEPVFEELARQAAQGEVLYNDDTTVKILAAMDERARQAALAEKGDDSAKKSPRERTGTFTSGIVSTREGRRMALFFSGHQHAGENLADVLGRRRTELPAPIQMCDALSRNLPGELKTLLANCLAHGRRQFVDVAEQFPDECRHVLESLAVVYHNDAMARERNLSPQERLLWHQARSGPAMEDLHAWLGRQLDERRVEPNSGLGKAMAYLLRHWEKLTLFLRVPGAPLDNNLCERALKKAIRHRRNSLFYKTHHGAHVGDVFMSLIHTCELCGANPFDYLTVLDRHADSLGANPQNWMPWNYRETLERTEHAHPPPEESPQDKRHCSQAAQDAGEAQEK
jgi:transposase